MNGTRIFVEIETKGELAYFHMQNTAKYPLELSGFDLTDQFIRGDKARSSEGNGLGLYIAKSLMELCHAPFSVNIMGDAFRVEIILPLSLK